MKGMQPTFIKDLDEQMGGGIPKGRIVLVQGDTGTFKTSFCGSIIYHNAKTNKKPGIFLSIKEEKDNVFAQMKSLGMNPAPIEDRFLLLDIASMRLSNDISSEAWLELMQTSITEIKKMSRCDLLVIDTINTMLLISNMTDRRLEIYEFFRWLKSLKMTVFMTSGIVDDKLISHLCDGIILMELNGKLEPPRTITITKMRGTSHPVKPMNLATTGSGFSI